MKCIFHGAIKNKGKHFAKKRVRKRGGTEEEVENGSGREGCQNYLETIAPRSNSQSGKRRKSKCNNLGVFFPLGVPRASRRG